MSREAVAHSDSLTWPEKPTSKVTAGSTDTVVSDGHVGLFLPTHHFQLLELFGRIKRDAAGAVTYNSGKKPIDGERNPTPKADKKNAALRWWRTALEMDRAALCIHSVLSTAVTLASADPSISVVRCIQQQGILMYPAARAVTLALRLICPDANSLAT